jgi:protein-S-isoprenylcysteine O-methyltransferase Ste14
MTTSSPPRHAGVNFPPPLLYVAGIALGWLLQRWRPLSITAGPSVVRTICAAAAFVIYLVLFGSALAAFRRARTTLIPNRPATAFVANGPYRFTRNPMYVSMAALYLAVAIFMNSWWAVLMLPLVLLVVDRFVIAREERYLGAAFPTEYAAFRARVRRWL